MRGRPAASKRLPERNQVQRESNTDPVACREAALKLIERTRRTRADLARRLKEKGYAATTVGGVLDRLVEVGLVDDVEFARAWLAGRWGRRPSGWRRLLQELRGKGIAEADVVRARTLLTERGSAPDEVASAAKLVEQARRRYAALEPHVQRQRLYALLARRGYDGDTIRRALELKEPLESGAEN